MKFGRYNPEVEYRRRPSAYAVIFDGQGKFAAVRWQDSFLLPGGGVDPGESLEEALAREVREECACEVVIGGFLGDAIQYFNNENGRNWEFHCSYFEAQFGSPLDSEPEHELLWLDVADAHKLAHEVHGWAVTQLARPIRWRIHLKSSPEAVFEMLATTDGRAKFWAESAEERDGAIHFVFPNGFRWEAKVIECARPHKFAIEYIGGSVATFELEDDGSGGVDLTLTDRSVPAQERMEVIAGWVSVLMALKAAVDFGVDLRNHDPQRTWDDGYIEN
jgi:8-oxo-dGTP pyrophosphatase MutT (NUDIX family)